MGEYQMVGSRECPLMARLAEWLRAVGRRRAGRCQRAGCAARRAAHQAGRSRTERQMSEAEEGLYAELLNTGSSAWSELHGTVTSQLTAPVTMPDGTTSDLPMAAVRGAIRN